MENVGAQTDSNRTLIASSLRTLADRIENSSLEITISEYVHSVPVEFDGMVQDRQFVGSSTVIHHNANDRMLLERLQKNE